MGGQARTGVWGTKGPGRRRRCEEGVYQRLDRRSGSEVRWAEKGRPSHLAGRMGHRVWPVKS
jgi:hypothetical protein